MSEQERLYEVEDAYRAGIRKALLWIYNPCSYTLNFSDCVREWQAMGVGLHDDKMRAAIEELKARADAHASE